MKIYSHERAGADVNGKAIYARVIKSCDKGERGLSGCGKDAALFPKGSPT
jgi:hypothetical protein